MGTTKIKKGLNLPINGEPAQNVYDARPVKKVALLGNDFIGMKPTFEVEVGDTVKTGQLLFTDKKLPLVRYTSPGAGKIVEINRGERRVFRSLVIELQGSEEIEFKFYKESELSELSKEQVSGLLLESGMWTSLRQRPFSKIANPEETPKAIFVTVADSNPLAPSMNVILEGNENKFSAGLKVISKLTDGKVYVCIAPETKLPDIVESKVSVEEFDGPHPSGNVGTHIHFLSPAGRNSIVWHINAQNLIAIGHLFLTGKLLIDRIISLGGVSVKEPRLLKTRVGASISDLLDGELKEGEHRIISGSVLSGFQAIDDISYLGFYHQQISVIPEDKERKFLGWLSLGADKHSVKNVVLSKIFGKKLDFSTAINGGHRAIVPSGSLEEVMPLDIIPTYLVRALAIKDVEEAEKLGALELDEEDLALCTYVDPSKQDYGPMLRENLTIIEKEG